MAEPMSTRVEVWAIAADAAGIWLVSGDDAWRPRVAVMADTEPHADVSLELAQHGALDDALLIHSTSWRVDGQAVVLSYVVVLACDGPVPGRWPGARPVGLHLAQAVGRPPTHAATQPPSPRYVDVLLHGLRHLRFLLDTDATSAHAMPTALRAALSSFTPALSSMYSDQHRSAA